MRTYIHSCGRVGFHQIIRDQVLSCKKLNVIHLGTGLPKESACLICTLRNDLKGTM